MPRQDIAEIDKTGAEAALENDYIVLIPGKSPIASAGFEGDFDNIEDFDKAIGPAKAEKSGDPVANDVCHKMARYLIKLGTTVHFVVIDNESELDARESDEYVFWKKYEDKGLYNLRFLTTGGYRSKDAAENIIKCAAERGDAIALVDIPQPEESGVEIDTTYVNNFIKSLVVSDVYRPATKTYENAFKYGACFAYDFNFKGEENTLFPGSFDYLSCFAKYTARFPDWFAFAGSVRGVSPFEGMKVVHEWGDADINILQDRTTEGYKAVNPITNIRPYGDIIWGNRTLYPLTRDVESNTLGLRASNFLNIRNLCCDIKKTLYRAARRYTFEPNSNVLWFNFVGAIKPLLEEMKSGQGIEGYKIIKENSDKKATLKATIKIVPIEAVEDFDLTVELADSISVTE